MNDQTQESVLLDQFPTIRGLVPTLPEFVEWFRVLPVVDVDDETFYVVGGDQLKDHDQVVVAWVNQFRPELFERNPES